MSRFNFRRSKKTAPAVTEAGPGSPVTTTGQLTANHQGGTGHLRDEKSELFLLAMANLVGQDTFYERGDDRDDRYTALVRSLAVSDPEWTLGLLRWLRHGAAMRTASLVGAAEFTRARLDAKLPGHSRQAIDAVLQRPDEPGELLAYWTSRYGRALPKPVKRGVADAVARLYNGRALLKYDTGAKGYRFGDVLELTHPTPDPHKPWQSELFRYALDRRHRPDTAVPPAGDALLTAHRALLAVPVEERRALVTGLDGARRLAEAGMTWEALAGWLQGPLDAAVWEAVIPSMGPMALVRNLRNFDQAGVSDEVAEAVARRISDRAEVTRSRQFPFRYLAAYRHAPSLRWGHALEQAMRHSLANVPALPGRSLILVDRSGSMFGRPSAQTQLNRADTAAIFGTALALRAAEADLVEFGSTSRAVPLERGDAVLRVLDRFGNLGGTDTAGAVRRHYRDHDRVLIVTDEQAYGGWASHPLESVPARIPVYTWNLAGYRAGHAPSGTAHRHTFGGLTDAAFRLVPLLEAGQDAAWPWEQ
ncbi:TROVE domain-containing protein [Kitasatospora griseola]|uniref:TROVE domain-containing protein n=1 Tax=Kitasatospora griseola TaxID=2064 RepID=UPI00167073A8|nr:TROVE domain-containing protein [Kitasatospora griseola]GGQ70354.1 RNA-binding protein [Kitasatospora griseola]